ncbi:hypothetical protein Vadar_011777 [Vaccinium darrowii]|uniref:Uncharacterized protein n=1 Tax=Vaccinium darrowii TaxID=229202 RepID=A0ACB7X046_9ERIC|nr:hypothetical protein Vadar_011777 [Vaccinium darrowii]
MGRPPCCDKEGVKKGSWTPEEDISLVSYIQEHGPGNWSSVPTNAGLLRCSKSCRLRWTNYLRPGIKRGNFSDCEEKMIIHLQALLGNRRSSRSFKGKMATTKKRSHLLLLQNQSPRASGREGSKLISTWPKKPFNYEALSHNKSTNLSNLKPNILAPETQPFSKTTYASSTENIARLLQNWKKNSPNNKPSQTSSETNTQSSFINPVGTSSSGPSEGTMSSATPEGFDHSIFGFHSDASHSVSVDETTNFTPDQNGLFHDESKLNLDPLVPLSLLEKWLFDDGAGAGQGYLMDHMSLGENDELF